MSARRIIVGISGASGIVYGVRMLEALRGAGVQTHLVMTRSAQLTLGYELAMKLSELQALADVVHRNENVGASIASGSFATLGMVVAPCSIRSLSSHYSMNFVARCVDSMPTCVGNCVPTILI